MRLSNEEVQTRLKDAQAHELDLTGSLREREHRICELTAELDAIRKQASDLTLRLQLAQVSLENARLAVENEGLRAPQTRVTILEARVSETQGQKGTKNATLYRPSKTLVDTKDGSLRGKLRRLLSRARQRETRNISALREIKGIPD